MANLTEKVLILGTNPLAWKVADVLPDSGLRYSIVGFVDDAYNSGGVLPRSARLVVGNGNGNGHATPVTIVELPANGHAAPHNGNGNGHNGNGHNGVSTAGNGSVVSHSNGNGTHHNGVSYGGNGNGFHHGNGKAVPLNGNGHGNGNGHHAPRYPFPILGPMDRLDNTIRDLRPHRIIVPFSEDGKLPVEALLNSRIEGVVVEDANELYERLTKKLAIESLPANLLIFSKEMHKPKRQLALRRLFSLAFGVVGLMVSSPVMAIIALAIKLDSRGPVFFIQQRQGYRGKLFYLIKFRTMHEGVDEEAGWVRDTDSRITRVGRWLRRYHLDEFPQFFNVIRGEMDVVGPRPEMACNTKAMSEEVTYFSLRTMVRPGLTGWAQIKSGYAVSREEVFEKIRYDLYYIKHMSWWLDLCILWKTAKILVLGREGA